jgi:hypothetical protein
MVEIVIDESGEVLEDGHKDRLCVRCGDPCDCDFHSSPVRRGMLRDHMECCSRCLRCRIELDRSEGG